MKGKFDKLISSKIPMNEMNGVLMMMNWIRNK